MSRKGSQSGLGKKVQGEEAVENPCGSCKKGVGQKEEGVQCEICTNWFHCPCQNVSEELYKALNMFSKDISWFCHSCKGGAEKVLGLIQTIQKRMNNMNEEVNKFNTWKDNLIQDIGDIKSKTLQEFTTLKDEVRKLQDVNKAGEQKKLEERLFKVENSTQKMEVEDLTKALIEDGSWAAIVKKHVNDKIDNVTSDMSSMQKQIDETKQMAEDTKQMAENEREKELRRRNVVVFNIPENAGVGGWKEQREEDLKFISEMVSQVVGEDIDKNEIGKLFRLGHREYNGSDASRPLLVEFIQGSTKNFVMQNINKLRSLDNYKNIVISHDMAKHEREECRKLVQEAKQRESNDTSGEYIYRVRGLPGQLKIVKLRKRY